MESDWKLQTEVKTLRSEADLKQCIEEQLPENDMRRPFTIKDMNWLDAHSWTVQDDKLIAVDSQIILWQGLHLCVCRYVEHGDYKYLAFGIERIGRTKIIIVTLRGKSKSVAYCASRIAMFLLREIGRLQRKGKKNERSGKTC